MGLFLRFIAIAGLVVGMLGSAQSGADGVATTKDAAVDIDGVALTLPDLAQTHPGALFQAQNTYYQAERKALDSLIDDYLLRRQAEREHMTVEKLLEKHVDSTIKGQPSDEALRVYYEGLDAKEPFETMRKDIIDTIRQTRITKAKAAYVQTLRSAAHIDVLVTAPRAPISLADTPILGPRDAPVMIIEYADYECPYCQTIAPALSKLVADYGGKVAVAYKDMPLPMHPHAPKAAEAAHCAGAQGKYWEYFDVLYSSKQLDIAQLKQHAVKLNLDPVAFDKCLDSGQFTALVESQMTEGRQELQLQGTPSFFVNGRLFYGGLTTERFHTLVDEELGGGRTVQKAYPALSAK